MCIIDRVLYVDLTYPPEQRNIGEVYNLITQCSESQLDSLFDVLPLTHPAKAPYSLYQRASDSVSYTHLDVYKRQVQNTATTEYHCFLLSGANVR